MFSCTAQEGTVDEADSPDPALIQLLLYTWNDVMSETDVLNWYTFTKYARNSDSPSKFETVRISKSSITNSEFKIYLKYDTILFAIVKILYVQEVVNHFNK